MYSFLCFLIGVNGAEILLSQVISFFLVLVIQTLIMFFMITYSFDVSSSLNYVNNHHCITAHCVVDSLYVDYQIHGKPTALGFLYVLYFEYLNHIFKYMSLYVIGRFSSSGIRQSIFVADDCCIRV